MRRILGGRSRSPQQPQRGQLPSDAGAGGQRRPPPARPGESSTAASQGSVGSFPAAAVPASTDGLDQKIRILRDDMLKQLKDLLAQPPSQDMSSLVDMLSQEASALVQDLQNHVEACMRYEQFDLVEQIVALSSEYEELSANAQRWKSAATGQTGHPPAPGSHHTPSPAASLGLPGVESRGGVPERTSSGQGFTASVAPTTTTGFQAALAGAAGTAPTASTSSGGFRSPAQGTNPQRQQEPRPLGANPLSPLSAISDAQRRQEEASRQEEEDRFGSFPQFDDRLPVQSDLGGLPTHGSSSSSSRRRPPGSSPSFQNSAGSPPSRPQVQDQRRNEARQTLKTTLEGSMREDPTVLQWALSEARLAGVGDVDPVLVEEGEQTLERVNAMQLQQEQFPQFPPPSQQSSLQGLQGLQGPLDLSPSGAGLPDDARSVGVASTHSMPRQESFSRQASGLERQTSALERQNSALEREAMELQRHALAELQSAAHGGDIDRLVRAIDAARSAGVPHAAIKRAEALLMAMKFAQGKLDKRPILRAWRAHIADLRSSRQVLKEALHRGVGADELEDAVDAASEAGVDEETCDMARTVANHRRAAHDQAASALASMDPDDLREAKSMNQAAGGPKSDEDQLNRALAQTEEDNRMMQKWDSGLPTAVDRYFEQLELEQKETQARIVKARQLEEETRRHQAQFSQKALQSAQLEDAAPEATQIPPSPQTARRSSSQQSLRNSASQQEMARAAEEWENEFFSMKSRVERARRWFATQERQHQHDEFLSMRHGGRLVQSGGLPATYAAADRATLPNFGTEPLPQKTGKRSLSRRRHVCGPGDEDEPPGARSQSPVSARASRVEQPRGSQTAMDSGMSRAMQTEYPRATSTAEPPQSASATAHSRSPPRAGPSRRRQVCGPSEHDSPPPSAGQEAWPGSTQKAGPSRRRQICGPSEHDVPPPSTRQEVQESLASLGAQGPHHSKLGAPVDKLGANAVAVRPAQPYYNDAPPASSPVQYDPPATWRSSATMPLEDPRLAQRPAFTSPDAGWSMPDNTQSPVPSHPPAAGPGRPVMSPYQVTHNSAREYPHLGGLPHASPAGGEPKVQASRNLPSRYKMGQAPEANPGRPVLLGQQQPVPSECPYPGSSALRSYPDVSMPAQGDDVAGGAGFGYHGYEDLRGASTYHNLMANAARMARKPEAEPPRHYEDPTYWR